MTPRDYASAARARAKELPHRIAAAVFIAAASAVFTHSWTPAIWLLAVVAAQFIDQWISRPLRAQFDREPAARDKIAFILSTTGSAVLFSSISVFCWFAGDIAGKAFAILMPAGTVLAMAIHIGLSRQLLTVSWAPHALYLTGLPILSTLFDPTLDLLQMAVLSLAGVVFLSHVIVAAYRIDRGAHALEGAMVDLDVQRQAAERANAAKSEFLATISHEIRTPMNAVVAAAQLLGRSPLDEAQAEHVAMLTNASEVLLGLLNDMLDLSKIESGKITLESASFPLIEKMTCGVELWRPRAAEKGVTLSFDPTGLPERLQTDPLRTQQILFNLLSNAVKFTERGQISVRGGRDAARGKVWFEVADSGCGMDEQTAARVFLKFEQADAGTARQHGGTGLGLSISRKLAELMGGSLSVTSKLGEGSVFRLELPLVEMEEPVVPSASAVGEVGAQALDVEGARILVAEDHAVNQRILRLMLEPIGCRLTIAGNGVEAVDLAANQPFDVILMDMQMPEMDGIEATRRIRGSAGANADTPIIALTANALAEHRAQWAALGVALFLAKPVSMDELIAVVSKSLEQRPGRDRADERVSA